MELTGEDLIPACVVCKIKGDLFSVPTFDDRGNAIGFFFACEKHVEKVVGKETNIQFGHSEYSGETQQ